MTYCDWVPGTSLPHDWFSCAWGGSFGMYWNDTYIGQGPLSLAYVLVILAMVAPLVIPGIVAAVRSGGRLGTKRPVERDTRDHRHGLGDGLSVR